MRFTRGRAPFRITSDQAASRHYSAPSGRDQTTRGTASFSSPRPRSLSRSPVPRARLGGTSDLPQNLKVCNSSPRVPLDRQGAFTPQNKCGSNPYYWSRDLHARRPEPRCQNRQDQNVGQLEVTHLLPQNDGSYQCPSDHEKSVDMILTRKGEVTLEQGVQVVSPEPHQQNGSPLPRVSEQKADRGHNSQYSKKLAACLLQKESDKCEHSTDVCVNGQSEQPAMPREQSTGQQDKIRMNNQQQGHQRRDQMSSVLWRETGGPESTQWSGRTHIQLQRNGQHISKNQQARQLTLSLQQNGSRVAHHHHHHYGMEHDQQQADTPLSANGFTHWHHQHVPLDNTVWNTKASLQQQKSMRAGRTPMGESHYEDLLKIMQLPMLNEHQHLDHLEADNILKALMGMRFTTETSQLTERGLGLKKVQQSQFVTSGEFRNQHKYVLSVSQQGNYPGFDRAGLNQTAAFNMPQLGVGYQGNVGSVPQSFSQHLPQLNLQEHQLMKGHLPSTKSDHVVQGQWRSSLTKDTQQEQQGLKESRAQYVYYMNNGQQKAGHPIRVQCQHKQRQQQPSMNQFTNLQDFNGNVQNSHYLAGPGRSVDAIQQNGQDLRPNYTSQRNVHGSHPNYAFLENVQESSHPNYAFQPNVQGSSHSNYAFQHNVQDSSHPDYTCQQNGLDGPNPQYADQSGRIQPVNGLQSLPSVTFSWSKGQDGISEGQVMEGQPMLENVPSRVGDRSDVKMEPISFVASTGQHAMDKDNSNVVLAAHAPDCRQRLQPVPINQPVGLSFNFQQASASVPGSLFPVPGSIHVPFFQPVKTPLYSPLPTPYFQPMNMPYHQQNTFQYPSPMAFYPFNSPGPVGAVPNIFQFPDPATMQQPIMEDSQPQPLPEAFGFAGNHPLVHFPPTFNPNAPPFEPMQPPATTGNDTNGNTVG